MKRISSLILALTISLSIYAANWFPFGEVNHEWNISLNGGYNHKGKVGIFGWGLTV